FIVVLERLGGPDFLPGLRIDGDEPAVQRAEVELAVPGRNAPRAGAAAGEAGPLGIDLRIVRPQLLAGCPVVGSDHVEHRGVVEDAVDHQRAGMDAAQGVEIGIPGHPELVYDAGVYMVEMSE